MGKALSCSTKFNNCHLLLLNKFRHETKNQSADLYLLEFRMRQSVDDRIPAAGSLGEKNGDFGNDRVDERRITPDTKNSVDHKRSPCNDP